MPASGKAANGITAVTGIGIGSNTHQKAQSEVIPAHQTAGQGSSTPMVNHKPMAKAKTGPANNAHRFLLCMSPP